MLPSRAPWLLIVAPLVWVSWGPTTDARAESARYALLVGCTHYDNLMKDGVDDLKGPANDIPLWNRLLTDPQGFHFPPENVTQLVGWAGVTPDKRPTCANIKKGFEDLIAKARPDDQVVIVLSGHGTQQPIPDSQKDPLDPKNPEPDGMDEVFLPADAARFDPQSDTLVNVLVDNEIGAYLDRLRARGAHVLIVFDCCHSGSMTRGVGAREVNRSVSPIALGIPAKKLTDAANRAREAVDKAEKAGKHPLEEATRVKPRADQTKGSLVAFFGCQTFEESPEVPRPDSTDPTGEKFYGMLSYTLATALEQRQEKMTYRELTTIMTARYRAERGPRSPTPYSEGDLDRVVLGMEKLPQRVGVRLERGPDGKLRVTGGSLRGLTPGSVLAVHPPEGDRKPVLGYVKVLHADLWSAAVEPCTVDGGKPTATELPAGARCDLYAQDVGDLRVQLAWTATSPTVSDALKLLPENVRRMVAPETDLKKATWVLRRVTPEEAGKEFGLTLVGDRILLLQGEGRDPAAQVAGPAIPGKPRTRKVYGQYPVEPDRLAVELGRDLPKIFRWQSLMRIASANTGTGPEAARGLSLQVARLKSKEDRTGTPFSGGPVRAGDILGYSLDNSGPDDLRITVIALDAQFGVEVLFEETLHRNRSWGPLPLEVEVPEGGTGPEGLLVLAAPVKENNPDYHFLKQEPLQVVDARPDRPRNPPTSLLGRVLHSAWFDAPQTRGAVVPSDKAEPVVLSRTWVTVK